MRINGISKLGKKLFFAMLTVCGGATLISCGTQVTPSSSGFDTSQKSDSTSGNSVDSSKTTSSSSTSESEQINSTSTQSSDSHSSDTSKESTSESKTSEESHKSSESSINSDDSLASQIAEQLKSYEEHIEETLKDKLNTTLTENYVDNVDIKYFSFEQDAKYNTTFFANGNISFVGDEVVHSVNLGLPLQGDYFLDVSPLYYVDVVKTNDLAQNYSVDQLAVVANYLDDEAITFSVAGLDGAKWDLTALTAAQIEKNLEEKYENLARETFKIFGNSEYIQNVDFKYLTVVYDATYGKLLKICGETGNIFNDDILSFVVSFKVSEENYDNLKNQILTTNYDKDADLRDNYTKSQLNSTLNIIDDETTSVALYSVDGYNYFPQSAEKNL